MYSVRPRAAIIREKGRPATCCGFKPLGCLFCRTFDISMGRERRAENATALRISWPPPSRTLPSMSVALLKSREAAMLMPRASCAMDERLSRMVDSLGGVLNMVEMERKL